MDKKRFLLICLGFLVAIAVLLVFIFSNLSGGEEPEVNETTEPEEVAVDLTLSAMDKDKITTVLKAFEENAGTYGIPLETLLAKEKLIAYAESITDPQGVYSRSDFMDIDKAQRAISSVTDEYAKVEITDIDFKYSEPYFVSTVFEDATFPEQAESKVGNRMVTLEVPFETTAHFVHYYTNSTDAFVTKQVVAGSLTISFVEKDSKWLIYSASDDAEVFLTDYRYSILNGEVAPKNQSFIRAYERSRVNASGDLVDTEDVAAARGLK